MENTKERSTTGECSLPPTLFNIYTNDQPILDGTWSFIYADDLCVTAQYPTFQEVEQQQLNANGIGNKLTELGVVLERNKVKVAVIQESKLSPKSKNLCIQNYTTVSKDRSHGQGGGLLILIHRSKLIISNVYIPQVSSCSNGYHSSIEHLLTTPDTLILGDFNAHHPSWYSRSTDTRGRKMADSINGSDYGILNWDSPTRVPPNAEPSSPDVSLASASLITSCSWQTLSTLSSDHLPILIRLQMKTPSNSGLRRTYVSLKKGQPG